MSVTRRVGLGMIGLSLVLFLAAFFAENLAPNPSTPGTFGVLEVLAAAAGLCIGLIGLLFALQLLDLSSTVARLIEPPPAAAILTAVLVFAAIGLLFFTSTGRDDTYISFWPAYTLAHQGQMINYTGDRVEQSSSLLYVIVMAAVGKLTGLQIEVVGKVLSAIFGAGAVVVVYLLTRRINRQAAFLAAVLVALCSYFVYWAYSGMETSLAALAALGLIAVYAEYLICEGVSTRFRALAAGMTAALMLTRPEMPLVVVALLASLLGLLWLKKQAAPVDRADWYARALRRGVELLAISAAVMGLIFAFRLLYFGDFFPQPVSVKGRVVLTEALGQGFRYFNKEFWRNPALQIRTVLLAQAAIYAAVRSISSEKPDLRLMLIVLFCGIYFAFVLAVGGDWMEGARFFVPMLPAALILLAVAAGDLVRHPVMRPASFATLLALQLLIFKPFVDDWSAGMPLWMGRIYYEHYAREQGAGEYTWFDRTNRDHMRDIPTLHYLFPIMDQIADAKDETVVIFTTQAGFLPYHTMQYERSYDLVIYDLAGLASRDFIECMQSAGIPLERHILFQFYREREAYTACGVPEPDIIMYPIVNPQTMAEVESVGFTIVYEQRGNFYYNSSYFAGLPLEIDQFIAVRSDLVDLLDEPYTYLHMDDLIPRAVTLDATYP